MNGVALHIRTGMSMAKQDSKYAVRIIEAARFYEVRASGLCEDYIRQLESIHAGSDCR
jgi:hypothetical protein